MAGHFLLASLLLLLLKVISTGLQTKMMRGDYRNSPNTVFFQMVYVTGKITPFLAATSAFICAMLEHDRAYSWFFGVFAAFIALLALYVVRLRKQGRFYGVLDLISKKRE